MTYALRAGRHLSTPPRRRASWRPLAFALALATTATLWSAAAASAVTITEFSAGLTPSSQPLVVVPGPNDEIWFTSSGLAGAFFGRVTAAGPATGAITEYTSGTAPAGITLGPDGNMWYVKIAPPGGVVRVTPQGVATDIDTPGVVPLSGIASGPDGNLWLTAKIVVAGRARSGIVRMTTAGVMTGFTDGISPNAQLQAIVLGPDGNMWFTERNGAIGRITPAGVADEFTTGISDNSVPFEIANGPDGNLWFTEYDCGCIGRITTDGVVTEFSTGFLPASSPTGIALGADDNLWFGDSAARRIGRITRDGVVTGFFPPSTPGTTSEPQSITPGPGRTLWFADPTGSRIGRVTIFDAPTVTTDPTTAVEATSAKLHATVNANGYETDVHFEYGTSTAYGTSATVVPITGDTATAVTAPLSGLTTSTTYFFKLVATNAQGTTESTGSFTTAPPPLPPTVTTGAATAIGPTAATLNGSVDAEGADTSAHFEYGSSLAYGRSTTAEPIAGSTATAVTAALPGLTPNTTYFFKLVATSARGTTVSTGSFTTSPSPSPPTVTTRAASAIAKTSATLNGFVDAAGADTSAHFEFGLTTAYGRATIDQPFTGDGATPIAAPVTALTGSTTYYFKLVATNAHGTSTSTGSFTTASPTPPPADVTPPAEVPPPAVAPPAPSRRAAVPGTVARDAEACPLVGTWIVGTDARDARSGGLATDLIFGLSGDDVLRGMAGADCIFGGPGADRAFGGAGADTLRGGDGADVAQGDAGDDALDGDAGNDRLTGGKGDDSIFGGAGNDRLTDTTGIDELKGGAGNDRISARDTSAAGRRIGDSVSCGAGRGDVAIVDRADRVERDCERVLRR
jgi:streptogramin lyase